VKRLVVKKIIKEGKIEEVINLYKELAEFTRKEEGCIKYELYQDEKDYRILVVIEEWKNNSALEKHWSSEHFARMVPMIGELTEKRFENTYDKLI
jgi:quinol monooxygenase YgiN